MALLDSSPGPALYEPDQLTMLLKGVATAPFLVYINISL